MADQWRELVAQFFEHDIFVSYDRDERPFVTWLEGRLRKRGYLVFWDRKIQGGRDFKEAIERAIEKSIAGVVIETPASRDSEWVGTEIHLLLQRGSFEVFPLIPLLLKGTDIRRELNDRHLNYVDFRNADWQRSPMSPATGDALEQLFRSLSFPSRSRSVALRTVALFVMVGLIAATIAVAAVSRLRYDAPSALIARSAQLRAIDRMLENRYAVDPQTSLPMSGTVPIGMRLTIIRQPGPLGEDVARDTWDGGYLRQREFLEGRRSLGIDAYVYEGKMLVNRVRRFTLDDDRTIEERWTPDGVFVGRYQVLDESGGRVRPLVSGADAVQRVPVTGAAWSIPLYR